MTAPLPRKPLGKSGKKAGSGNLSVGRCLCGAVEISVHVPVFWAWHDHSRRTQRSHGAAYATFAGCWKSKLKISKGAKHVRTFVCDEPRETRSFCGTCGTPLIYARGDSPKMVNIPRALFDERVGREAKYHVRMEQSPGWAYQGEKLSPVKAYPGLLQSRPKRKSDAGVL